MNMSADNIKALEQRIKELENENTYLMGLLDQAGISYDVHKQGRSVYDNSKSDQGSRIFPVRITEKHARILFHFFKGRQDVYSLRSGKPSKKTGKFGYYPKCDNFWVSGICPRREGMKLSCSKCANKKYRPINIRALMAHLIGQKADCSDVVGIYPMLKDETCNFLVFDFDNHDDEKANDDSWKEDVNALRRMCENMGVSCLVERSRSGNGVHIWIFFAEPIPAKTARAFGSALLTKGAEAVNMKSFRSYDRMIPMQDHLPDGGLGNLIALPLQGQALKKGNSAFIDENWDAYPDQWGKLISTKELSKQFVEDKIKEWTDGRSVLGVFPIDEVPDADRKKAKPWKRKIIRFSKDEVNGKIRMTRADGLYIDTGNLKPSIQNKIRKFATFSNPAFYKKQAMGFSTGMIPRIVYCGEDIEEYIHLPAGCFDSLMEKINEAGIPCAINDERADGRKIKVSFNGELYPQQQKAAMTMLANENGILAATTAFGKTVVGAYMIAQRKVSALILVHNTEIMNNWITDLERFLVIDEELPEYTTKTGKKRKRKSVIGRLYASHNSLAGIIDIAMIGSLARKEDIDSILERYGLVIMDECHHGAAALDEAVMKKVRSRYVYGLTATPKRDDGQEKKVYMYFGPIRYRFTAKDRASMQQVNHYVYPRFTRLICSDPEGIRITDAYQLLINDELRNEQIIKDVTTCVAQGYTPLVITKNRMHAEYLYKKLKTSADRVFLMIGQRKKSDKDAMREDIKKVTDAESVILVATGQYVGEGFNFPRLDTMMLTMPVSWSGIVEQYAGRLHRDYAGKKNVIIYDYVDSHIRVLEKMYHKRLATYKKMGYEICSSPQVKAENVNAVFDKDSFIEQYDRDIGHARKAIVISSPGLNEKSVNQFIDAVESTQQMGTQVVVVTLDPKGYPLERVEKTQRLIDRLIHAGIKVNIRDQMHEHFTIIDDTLVWYGSLNFLSRAKQEDNLIRIEDREVARELLEMTFIPAMKSNKQNQLK